MYPFHRRLRNGLRVESTRLEHADALAHLQTVVFPTLAPELLIRAEHYAHTLTLFPEGQLVVLDGGEVVGMTTTVRYHLDRHHPRTFDEVLQGGWCTGHEPDGTWLYGLDVGVHPRYRGKGVGRAIYAARQQVLRALGLRGQATAGMLNGYGARRDAISLEDYYAGVISGAIIDPTVSFQMQVGFEPHGLQRDYLDDPACAGACVDLRLVAERDVPADWAA